MSISSKVVARWLSGKLGSIYFDKDYSAPGPTIYEQLGIKPGDHYTITCDRCGEVTRCRCNGPRLEAHVPSCPACHVTPLTDCVRYSPVQGQEYLKGIRYLLATQHEDLVPGGLADKKKPSDFDPKQLAKGVKVEMEHTDDRGLAQEISMDHLTEDPDYYIKLQKMERD